MTKRQPTTHNPGRMQVTEATDFDTGAGDDDALSRPATPRVVDFAVAARQPDPQRPGRIIDRRDEDPNGHVMTSKRVRARARRAWKRNEKILKETQDQIWKPMEEWDMEELARGRPRAVDGSFKGRFPDYISREVHEQAMEQFKKLVRADMNGQTVDALQVLGTILNNDQVDRRGKAVVPPSTKLDAAKFLIEHVLGKAVQPTTTDISAKLQLVLGAAMVNPVEGEQTPELEGYRPAHIGHRVEAEDLDEDGEIVDAEVVDWE